jgi:hypothetical protein
LIDCLDNSHDHEGLRATGIWGPHTQITPRSDYGASPGGASRNHPCPVNFEDPPFRADFWKGFKSHIAKIQTAYVALAPLAATDALRSQPFLRTVEQFGRAAQADHATKLRGLYADYQDRAVVDPAEVTEHDARNLVAHARDGLDLLAPLVSDGAFDPEFTMFLTAQSAHFMTLFDDPNADGEAIGQQLLGRDPLRRPGTADMVAAEPAPESGRHRNSRQST